MFYVQTTLNLTSQAKIYVEFGKEAAPRLQRLDGTPSCKIGVSAEIPLSEAFCRVVGARRLMVIMNRDDFTIDNIKQQRLLILEVSGVTQPSFLSTTSSISAQEQQIWLGIDKGDRGGVNNNVSGGS